MAVLSLSPVSIITLSPIDFKLLIAVVEVSFNVSASPRIAHGSPSTAKNTAVFPTLCNRSSCSEILSTGTEKFLIRSALPNRTLRPSTSALTPKPGMASKFEGDDSSDLSFLASLTTACARGCSLPSSADPAKCNMDFADSPFTETTSVTDGSPLVRVPVLSNTIVSTL